MTHRVVLFLVAGLIFVAPLARAQDCSVGVYGDPLGHLNIQDAPVAEIFSVYVLLFGENVYNAASYQLDFPGLNVDMFIVGADFGSSPFGFNVETPNGNNVALGECAVGFGGNPIRVARYDLLFPFHYPARIINVAPNPDESTENIVVSTCTGELVPCETGGGLVLFIVATESASFGEVKRLYLGSQD